MLISIVLTVFMLGELHPPSLPPFLPSSISGVPLYYALGFVVVFSFSEEVCRVVKVLFHVFGVADSAYDVVYVYYVYRGYVCVSSSSPSASSFFPLPPLSSPTPSLFPYPLSLPLPPLSSPTPSLFPYPLSLPLPPLSSPTPSLFPYPLSLPLPPLSSPTPSLFPYPSSQVYFPPSPLLLPPPSP